MSIMSCVAGGFAPAGVANWCTWLTCCLALPCAQVHRPSYKLRVHAQLSSQGHSAGSGGAHLTSTTNQTSTGSGDSGTPRSPPQVNGAYMGAAASAQVLLGMWLLLPPLLLLLLLLLHDGLFAAMYHRVADAGSARGRSQSVCLRSFLQLLHV